MPFKKIGPDSYVSPSGRKFTKKQVVAYYATDGFTKPVQKSALDVGSDSLYNVPLSFNAGNLSLEDETALLAKAVPVSTGILTAAVLIPDKADFQGHIYNAEEIALAHQYFLQHRKIGVEHGGKTVAGDNVDIMDSRILDRAEDFDGQILPKGTWVMSVHIEDPALWLKVEHGDINGFSIQGKARLTVEEVEAIAGLDIPFQEARVLHDYGTTQFNLTAEQRSAILRYAQQIDPNDLSDKGVELSPHITVKYGLHTTYPNEVQDAVSKGPNKAVSVMFGLTHAFTGGKDGDVLHVDIDSPSLHTLHDHLDGMLDNTNTFTTYHPHVTIAYLKPGAAKKYEGSDFIAGLVHSFYTLVYTSKYGDESFFTMMPPGYI